MCCGAWRRSAFNIGIAFWMVVEVQQTFTSKLLAYPFSSISPPTLSSSKSRSHKVMLSIARPTRKPSLTFRHAHTPTCILSQIAWAPRPTLNDNQRRWAMLTASLADSNDCGSERSLFGYVQVPTNWFGVAVWIKVGEWFPIYPLQEAGVQIPTTNPNHQLKVT